MGQKGRPATTGIQKKTFLQLSPELELDVKEFLTDNVLQNIEILQKLAQGGYAIIEEHWVPAALVTVKMGGAEIPAFPDIVAEDPTKLILTLQVRRQATPDRAALIDLLNRTMGKPVEQDLTEVIDAQVRFEFEQASGSSVQETKELSDEVKNAITEYTNRANTEPVGNNKE